MPKRSAAKERQDRSSRIKVRGAAGPSMATWIEVRDGKKRIWIKHSEFMTDLQRVKQGLAQAGIIVVGKDSWRDFLALVEGVRSFPPRNLIEHPGWTNECFALQDGRVFTPSGIEAFAVFPRDLRKCESAGTLEGWLERVAEPLAGQMLAMFMLMSMFVAPLLKLTDRAGNIGFELVGVGGTGKSMLLKLMASIIGGGADRSPSRYWNTCKTTLSALEKKAEAHSDLPLLLDDATSFAGDETGSARGRKFKMFVFDLSQGETKDRLDGKEQRSFRLAYYITSNLSLSDVISEIAEQEQGATKDRHITFDVDIPPLHTLEFLPTEYPTVRSYADTLVRGMADEYGTAMPRYLQGLVNHRARDEEDLKAAILRRTEAFVRLVGADLDDGPTGRGRVAEIFGLTIAAGRLAQRYGALPKSFDCKAAGLAAYRLHQASAKRLSALERVVAYATGPKVLNMEALGLKHISRKQLRNASGIFRPNRDGEREFLVSPETFKEAFPDHRTILGDPELRRLMARDGRHKGIKREVCKGWADERFYCFRLSQERLRKG